MHTTAKKKKQSAKEIIHTTMALKAGTTVQLHVEYPEMDLCALQRFIPPAAPLAILAEGLDLDRSQHWRRHYTGTKHEAAFIGVGVAKTTKGFWKNLKHRRTCVHAHPYAHTHTHTARTGTKARTPGLQQLRDFQ